VILSYAGYFAYKHPNDARQYKKKYLTKKNVLVAIIGLMIVGGAFYYLIYPRVVCETLTIKGQETTYCYRERRIHLRSYFD
jgi:hypothetical protein